MELIVALCAAILAFLVWRAVSIVHAERQDTRGTKPGDPDAEIVSEYSSGVGGGQYQRYTVPSDPEQYAKTFVPKSRKSRT